MAKDGRGNFGRPEQHRAAGSLGGKAPHKVRGLQGASLETRQRVARLGGGTKGKKRSK